MEYMILHINTVWNFFTSCPSCTLAAVTSGWLRMSGKGRKTEKEHQMYATGRRAEQHTKSGDVFIVKRMFFLMVCSLEGHRRSGVPNPWVTDRPWDVQYQAKKT